MFSAGFESSSFDLSLEINKNLFNLIDYMGIYVALKYKSTIDNPQVRILAFTIGWSLFEAICSHLFFFIMHATGDEFSWKYVLRGVSSNLDIVDIYCIVAMIMLLSRNIKKAEGFFNFTNILILLVIVIKAVILPIYSSYLHFQYPISELNLEQLIVKGVFTATLLALVVLGKMV